MRHATNFWTTPWRPANDVFGFAPVFDLFETDETARTFLPACEVDETKDGFSIRLDMPGVSKDGIKVEVNSGRLLVSAERKEEKAAGEKENIFFSDRQYGRFERIFDLGDKVDLEKIDAVYQDGVLKITLAKAETAKPRQITVRSDETLGSVQHLPDKKEKPLN